MDYNNYILNYINDGTRSILLNGEWGTGKTYFVKNKLIPFLKSEIFCDNNKKIIYVSLNGIKTTDEIIIKIISSRLDINNKLLSGISTLKNFLDIGLSIFGIDKINLDNKEKIFNLLDFKNDFFIFDDLERTSSDLCINDLLGFINTYLIEHNNYKVLFIADETKIKDEHYYEIKEKIIEHTYIYKPDINEIYKDYYEKSNSEDLKSFYINNQQNILDLFIKFEINNLRTIFYCFKIFDRIIPIIKENLSYQKTYSLILFVISISNEVKSGKITSLDLKDKKELDKLSTNLYTEKLFKYRNENISSNSNNEKKLNKDYGKKFSEKYLDKNTYTFNFYNSIFELVINGDIENEKLLFDFKTEEKFTNDWDKSRELMMNFRNLSEHEVFNVVEKVYNYALEKKFVPLSYGNLYHWLSFFSKNKILKISLKKLKFSLIKSLKDLVKEKGLPADQFSRETYLLTAQTENPIEKEITDLINKQKKIETKKEIKEFLNNISDEKKTIDFFIKYKAKVILKEININSFSSAIKKANSKTLSLLYYSINDRYGFSNIREFYKDEVCYLEDLVKLISKNRIANPVRKLLLNDLINSINEIIERLK